MQLLVSGERESIESTQLGGQSGQLRETLTGKTPSGSSAAPRREGGEGGRERGGAGHPSPSGRCRPPWGKWQSSGGAESSGSRTAQLVVSKCRAITPVAWARVSSAGQAQLTGWASAAVTAPLLCSPLPSGSTAPGPVPAGLIRLYSMRFCPFVQRTRLVLRAKGIK